MIKSFLKTQGMSRIVVYDNSSNDYAITIPESSHAHDPMDINALEEKDNLFG
jgi:hypothetical protein